MANPTTLCAYYARTSTEEQKEQQTIDSQVSALETEIGKQKDVLVEKYIEDGFTGTVLDRPALDRLRADAQKKVFQKLYIFSPDRLARELMLQLLVVKELKNAGIEVVFLSQRFSDSPADRLLFQMLGAISEFERAQILERTRRGKLHKARAGILLGGIPKFGYTYVKKTETAPGRYEINSDEADVVQEVFRLFILPQVLGIRTLAKELHRLGFKNRGGNTKWAKSSLSRILVDSTYIGTTYFNKSMVCERLRNKTVPSYKSHTSRRVRPREEWIPIKVPALISEKLFAATQSKLAKNRELSIRNAKYDYLLKGLVFCACGKKMYGYPCHGKPRYKCSDKYLAYPLPKTCERPTLDVAVLDNAVWPTFLQVLDRPEVIVASINQMQGDKDTAQGAFEKRRAQIDKDLLALAPQEERLLKAYAEKVINLSQLESQLGALRKKTKALSQEKRGLEIERAGFKPELSETEVTRHFASIKEKARGASFELRRQIIRLFVDHVIVDHRKVLVKAYLPKAVSTESQTGQGRERNGDYGELVMDCSYEGNRCYPFNVLVNLDNTRDVLLYGSRLWTSDRRTFGEN